MKHYKTIGDLGNDEYISQPPERSRVDDYSFGAPRSAIRQFANTDVTSIDDVIEDQVYEQSHNNQTLHDGSQSNPMYEQSRNQPQYNPMYEQQMYNLRSMYEQQSSAQFEPHHGEMPYRKRTTYCDKCYRRYRKDYRNTYLTIITCLLLIIIFLLTKVIDKLY